MESAPPVVIKTVPVAGATDIDPSLAEIRVTFSKEMQDKNWSLVKASDATFPEMNGQIRYDEDRKTCVIPVKLEPGKDFALWLNTSRFGNFKDKDGKSAIPYLLVFRTAGERREAKVDFRRSFDALVDDMGRNYSYFELKGVDWEVLSAKYRDKASSAKTSAQFVETLTEMLAELRDGHVWIEWSGRALPTWRHDKRSPNYNRQVTNSVLEDLHRCGEFALIGLTKKDRFAAVVIVNQGKADSASVQEVVDFIRSSRESPGFIVDLRTASGGDERLARQIAESFCPEEVTYARSKYRSGPAAGDFGPTYDRVLKARSDAYAGPVVCLIGDGCVSSGEGFAKMMAALPRVTLVGEPTRGSSGNPKPFAIPGVDVTVWYSRWVDLMPDGAPVEGRGVPPDVRVDESPEAYLQADPTWERGMETLREHAARKTEPLR